MDGEWYYNGEGKCSRIAEMTREELIEAINELGRKMLNLERENLEWSRKWRGELLRQGGYQ